MAGSADFLAGLGAEPETRQRRSRTRQKVKQEPVMYDAERAGALSVVMPLVQKNMREIIIASGFVLLIGAAGINAVFLQTGKHPAPLFAGEGVGETITAAIPKPREIILDQTTPEKRPDPVVLEIQRHLYVRGYYDAEIDGLMGARTSAAIGLYQRAFGELVTNEASQTLLEHIRLSKPDAAYHAAARERVAKAARESEEKTVAAQTTDIIADVIDDPERIKQVQRALSKLGFGNLVADGVAGRNTRKAVARFKEKHGLQPTGSITTSLFNELIKLKQL